MHQHSYNVLTGGGACKVPSLTPAEEIVAQLIDPEVVQGLGAHLESESGPSQESSVASGNLYYFLVDNFMMLLSYFIKQILFDLI